MALENDNEPCAVLLKEHGQKTWRLQCFTLRKSVAFRTADMLEEGTTDKCMVVLRDDYDAGKIKPLKPPTGFKLLDGQEPYSGPEPFGPPIVLVKPKVIELSTKLITVKPALNRYGVGVKCDRYSDPAEKSKQLVKLGKEMLGLDI